MSHSGAPKATAQGTLAKTPFAHLMQFAMGRELTGTLAVWPDGAGTSGPGQDRVLFEKGVPTAMRCLQPAANLAAGLLQLFARTQAPYAFYEGQDLLGRSTGVLRDSLDPFSVLALGVRKYATPEHVEPVLRQLGARPLRLRIGLETKRLVLEPPEMRVVEDLRRSAMTVAEACEGHDTALAHRVIYLLTLVKGLETLRPSQAPPRPRNSVAGEFLRRSTNPGDPYRSSNPPGRNSLAGTQPGVARVSRTTEADPTLPEGGEPLPPKPAGLSPEDAEQWDELAARYPKLDELNHFQLLGVDTRATSSDITSAYFTLVKRWHPERVGQALAGPLEDPLRLYFERLTEAHEVLASEEKRAEYLKTVQQGGGTRKAERMMADVVDAAMLMQKAEVLLRRRAHREALAMVEQAVAKSPEDADNYATRGWLRLLTAPADDAPLDEILRDIDRTLAHNKDHAKANYYKGVVLKRRGNLQQALKHFEKARQLDPRNIEAEREVRLARIRGQSLKPPAAKKGGGLWGKLFKG